MICPVKSNYVRVKGENKKSEVIIDIVIPNLHLCAS